MLLESKLLVQHINIILIEVGLKIKKNIFKTKKKEVHKIHNVNILSNKFKILKIFNVPFHWKNKLH